MKKMLVKKTPFLPERIFLSVFVAAGGIFDPGYPVLEMSLSQWKKGQPIKKR